MSLCTVIVEFQAKAGQATALAEIIEEAIQHTIKKPGCYEVTMLVDDDNPEQIVLYEKWLNADGHKAYAAEMMNSPKMEQFMALMTGPPKSRWMTHTASGGGKWGGPEHLEICSTDVEATKGFLSDVFGWSFSEGMPGYDMFLAPGGKMGGLRPKMPEEPAPQAILYLTVDDLDARLERVTAAGGTITVPIQEVPNAGRFFWFVTPGGLQLAAWQSFPKG